jgi:hypothetical protein
MIVFIDRNSPKGLHIYESHEFDHLYNLQMKDKKKSLSKDSCFVFDLPQSLL